MEGRRRKGQGWRRYLHWCRAKPGHCSPQAAQGCPLCGSSAGFFWRQTGGREVSEGDGELPECHSAAQHAVRRVSPENICLFIHSRQFSVTVLAHPRSSHTHACFWTAGGTQGTGKGNAGAQGEHATRPQTPGIEPTTVLQRGDSAPLHHCAAPL